MMLYPPRTKVKQEDKIEEVEIVPVKDKGH